LARDHVNLHIQNDVEEATYCLLASLPSDPDKHVVYFAEMEVKKLLTGERLPAGLADVAVVGFVVVFKGCHRAESVLAMT